MSDLSSQNRYNFQIMGFRLIVHILFSLSVLHIFNTLWSVNIPFVIGFVGISSFAGLVLYFVRSRVGCFIYLFIIEMTLFAIAFESFPDCVQGTRIEFFVMTIPRNKIRFMKFEAHMQNKRIEYTELAGVDALLSGSGPERVHMGDFVFVLGIRRALLSMLTHGDSEWVLLFEDDANLFDWSLKKIHNAACHYKDADMIWLDTRGAVDWFFLGSVSGGMVGTLFRRSSIMKVYELMDPEGEMFQESLFSYNPTGKNDDYLAHLCKRGILKCAQTPLVRESRDKSSHI